MILSVQMAGMGLKTLDRALRPPFHVLSLKSASEGRHTCPSAWFCLCTRFALVLFRLLCCPSQIILGTMAKGLHWR